MKRLVVLLFLAACSHESSSGEAPAASATTTPSATASAVPSASAPSSTPMDASAAPIPSMKPTAGAPSSMPFCKGTSIASEPLLALCATGQDWSKAHFDCVKPLPRNFCADLSVWGCQYTGANEKAPKTTFEARFVRGGVALREGEMIDDNTLRARFPRAGTTRGVSVKTTVANADEGTKLVATESRKLVTGGCVALAGGRFDCGSWQARADYDATTSVVTVGADTPTAPDCSQVSH